MNQGMLRNTIQKNTRLAKRIEEKFFYLQTDGEIINRVLKDDERQTGGCP